MHRFFIRPLSKFLLLAKMIFGIFFKEIDFLKKSIAIFLCLLSINLNLSGREPTPQEEQAIKANAKAYEEAFNSGNLNALPAFWAEEATYHNPKTKEVIQGKAAILQQISKNFDKPDRKKISIRVDKIEIPEEGKVIEIGESSTTDANGDISLTVYKATLRLINGKWVIESIREMESELPPTHYSELKSLDWLVGSWMDTDENKDVSVITTSGFDRYKNFLIQNIKIEILDESVMEVMQIIGWDPEKKVIRSWVYDSDGGFGEGYWKKEGDSFAVETTFTLPNGSKGSAKNIYSSIDKNTYSWSSTNRMIDGKPIADIKPAKLIRIEKGE